MCCADQLNPHWRSGRSAASAVYYQPQPLFSCISKRSKSVGCLTYLLRCEVGVTSHHRLGFPRAQLLQLARCACHQVPGRPNIPPASRMREFLPLLVMRAWRPGSQGSARWHSNRTFRVSDEMNWVEIVWIMMFAASLMLGVIHLFVWLKQRSQYAHLLFFVLAVSAAAFGAFELAMMQAADHPPTTPPRCAGLTCRSPWSCCRLSGSCISISTRAGSGSPTRSPGFGWSRSALNFADRRQHQLSRDHRAGPGDALGRRRRLRAGRCRESVGDRAPGRQPAARRVRRRCFHHALASRRSRRAPPRGRRRRQSRSLH